PQTSEWIPRRRRRERALACRLSEALSPGENPKLRWRVPHAVGRMAAAASPLAGLGGGKSPALVPAARTGGHMSMLNRAAALVAALAMMPLVAVTVRTQAPQGKWAKAAPFPEPDEEMYGITANGKIYVIGGFGLNGVPRGVVYEYDDASDKWTKKASMPAP